MIWSSNGREGECGIYDGSGGDDNGKDDNGKNGDDKRDDRSRLPRTGSELTAAGAGLALLAIGTAGIMLTRRRS